MIRRGVAVALALGLVAGIGFAHAQDTELSAADLFTKSLEIVAKQEGFHIKLSAEVSLGEGMAPMAIVSNGWVRNPDLAYFKVTQMGGQEEETWRRGKKSLRRDATGQWQLEEDQGGRGDNKLTNPLEYLNEFSKYSKGASYLENEKLGDVECRVVKSTPPATAIRSFIGGIGIPEQAINWDTAKLSFRVWIGKDDFLVRQLIADLEIELAGMGGDLTDPGFDEDEPTGSDPAGKEGAGKKQSRDEGNSIDRDGKQDGDEAKKGDDKKTDEDEFDEGDEFSQPMKLTPQAKFLIFDYNKDIGADKIPADVKKKLGIE